MTRKSRLSNRDTENTTQMSYDLPMAAFHIAEFTATSWRDGSCATVQFGGELELTNEGLARAEVEIALDRGGSELVLDLRQLTFLDARGVHVLLDALSACEARQRQLLVMPAPPRVQRILDLCGVGARFEPLAPAEPAEQLAA
jgi:anti-anti-sigma factor